MPSGSFTAALPLRRKRAPVQQEGLRRDRGKDFLVAKLGDMETGSPPSCRQRVFTGWAVWGWVSPQEDGHPALSFTTGGRPGSSGLPGETAPSRPPTCPKALQGPEWGQVFKTQTQAHQRAGAQGHACAHTPVRTHPQHTRVLLQPDLWSPYCTSPRLEARVSTLGWS